MRTRRGLFRHAPCDVVRFFGRSFPAVLKLSSCVIRTAASGILRFLVGSFFFTTFVHNLKTPFLVILGFEQSFFRNSQSTIEE